MPLLDFSWDTMFLTQENYDSWLTDYSDLCPPYKDLFIRGLNQFLQFYEGTQLVSFKVCFCLGRDFACDNDHWVNFALSKGVEQLSLALSCLTLPSYETRHQCRRHELYIFRPVLLYGSDVSKLKLLSLRSCILGPDFHSILYLCLNLESMILLDCCLPVKLCISGSHLRLKSLEITNCTGMKQIDATSLTSFEHHGVTSFKHHGARVKFSFSTPSLEKVSIGTLDRRGVRYIFSKLAKDLPRVKTLSFIPVNNWVKCIPKQIGLFFPFIKVEQLNFFALGNTNFDIRRIIAVLRACPRLQKFHLVTRNPVEYVQEGMPVPTKSVHKYLKES
ncbi:hypothetical protein L1049_023274 [Liquidambar formosana]|uniref:At1g61320/AtMIF1 LRR domain-containing protein n=1 Tax=Liquidambar formosana TaxID=63359 RepID=A0AAP0WYQ9_LIQFO